MTGRKITVRQWKRGARNAHPIKPEEGVEMRDGEKIKVSDHGNSIASSMERRRVTPPEIAQMQKKLRKGSRAGQLRNLRYQLLNLGK
jgi:hypothetical protein